MENILILRSPFKIPKAIVTPAKHPITGRYADCVRRVDSKGDMILSREDQDSGVFLISEIEEIELYDGKVFNLDDEYDNKRWEAIKHHKFIAKTRDERDPQTGVLIIDGDAKKYGTADWYVEIPGIEANSKNITRRKRVEAQNYILNDTPEERLLKAKILGKAMRNAHESDVEDYLMQEAERNPTRIITLYTGGDMKLRLLLLKAKEDKIIQIKDKLWMYGDEVLGASDDSVVEWMKRPLNKKILEILKQETYPEMYEQKEK